MELKLYNTLTREKEVFKPIDPAQVSLYCCGPTVYNYAHIGNMRTYVFEDILRRAIRKAGYKLSHVMNITDVGHMQSDADAGDDKMVLASKREKKSPWDIAKFYEEEFFRQSEQLNVQRPDTVCRATEHIPEMIAMVQKLVENGYAYFSREGTSNQGNVYFDVSKFDRYTEFARLRLEAQTQTERVENDSLKRNQADFALWFSVSKFPDQIMQWDSPWGRGFPGWHIECSAMASKYLGDRIDIHCGGIDHIPVHHTNEIAQSECCHGHKWVNYWLHGEFLNVDSGKMSKSKGDILTVDTLVKDGFEALDYRFLILTAHYRSELKFSYDALTGARTTYIGLKERVLEWRKAGGTAEESAKLDDYRKQFFDAVMDDLHMPIALTVLWAVAKDDSLSPAQKLKLASEFDEIMGLKLLEYVPPALEDDAKAKVQALVDARIAAKQAKNFAEADRLRDELVGMGIELKDSPQGTEWRFKG